MDKDFKSQLCFRCEHRAQFLETGNGPRCECQNPTGAVYSCYMYKPTLPLILEKNKDDNRPQFGPAMISSRSHAVGIAEGDLSLKAISETSGILYWKLKKALKNERILHKLHKKTSRKR